MVEPKTKTYGDFTMSEQKLNPSARKDFSLTLRSDGYLIVKFGLEVPGGETQLKFVSHHRKENLQEFKFRRISLKKANFLLKMGFVEKFTQEYDACLGNLLNQAEVAIRSNCYLSERVEYFMADFSNHRPKVVNDFPRSAGGEVIKCQKTQTAERIVSLGGRIISDDRGSCPSGSTGSIKVQLPEGAELTAVEEDGGSDGPWVTKRYKIGTPRVSLECFTGNASSVPTCKIS